MMDLEILNQALAAYNIEIVCEACETKRESVMQESGRKSQQMHTTEASSGRKREEPKVGRCARLMRSFKKGRGAQIARRGCESHARTRKSQHLAQVENFGSVPRNSHVTRQAPVFHPPKNFLNLKSGAGEVAPRVSFQELLESHRNTPNKIEEVEIDHFYYSDKKENSFRHNIVSAVLPLPSMMYGDQSPFSAKQEKQVLHEQNFKEPFALGVPRSRDVSPLHTPFHPSNGTPCPPERTPRHQIQLTPNLRNLDHLEEGQEEHFNLLENPFEKKL